MTITRILVAFLFFFMPAFAAHAATLSATPSQTTLSPGSSFSVRIAVNAGGQAINNAEGVLEFPANLLSVSSVSKGGSIFTIWVEEPAYSNAAGTVSFNGGLPNPGYSGSSGTVLTVTFTAKQAGNATIAFDGAAVRANDGSGTDVLTSATGAALTISSPPSAEPAASAPAPASAPPAGATEQAPAAAGLGPIAISSASHPSQAAWYPHPDAFLSWLLPRDVAAVQLIVSEDENAPPSVTYEPPIARKEVADLGDGTWYFRMRAKASGAWGEVSTFRLNVDATQPAFAEHSFAYDETARKLVVSASAADASSGIAGYEILIDDDEPVKLGAEAFAEGSYALAVRSKGDHKVTLRAIDQAGNVADVSGAFTVPATALDAPVMDVGSYTLSLAGLVWILLAVALAALGVASYAALRPGRAVPMRPGIEKDIHRSFSLYRSELVKNLKLLERARAKRALTSEETKLHKSMVQNLEDLERFITDLLRKLE